MTDDVDDPICNECGKPRSKHGVDQMTLEPTKCPISPGDSGHTPVNNEGTRERQNMKRAQKADDIDEQLCSHPYGTPHEAEYEEQIDGTWIPVCDDHVDPTNPVRDLYPRDK